MYAVTWQHLRNVAILMDGGPETAIHKSTDAGKTWRKLSNGLPEEDMAKTGLAISPINPDVIYATIELENRTGGFWRSEDGGESWEKRNDYLSSGTGPHYYQEIFASPHKMDLVYQADVFLHYTDDGGKNFVKTEFAAKHTDHHAVAFDPNDANYIIVGNDGGVYESFDGGTNWKFAANLPVTQYYKVSVDYDEPFYNIYGGTQDNSTQGGPSRTKSVSGIANSDWFIALGGDGHQPAADPTNPDIVYAEWQQGNLTRFDRKTGETVYIQPQEAADEPRDRFNWDSPILISPHDSKRLYHASQRVWRSDDRGDSWTPISGDLSRGIDRLTQPIMGRVPSFNAAWDIYAMSKYGTVTSLSESPLVDGLLYAGTDDGLIHVSENGGQDWRMIDDLPGVPDNFFVNDIKADLHDADTVYVIVDDHKSGDFSPYVLKSTNRGRSWSSIAGNLPERYIVWRLVQDHVKQDLLFLGTEFGVYFSVQGGHHWIKLEGGVPTISFRDLAIQKRENDLVGATFGRGFYVLDDYSALREVTTNLLENESRLFPVRNPRWYVPRRPLGCDQPTCKASQGAAFYQAPNPPFGAVFTYYLAEDIRTTREQRVEDEKPLIKAGDDTPYPGWDAIIEEELEDKPSVVLTVRDSDGNIVRHIDGLVTAGFHRVAWDLRYPVMDPWKPADERGMNPWDSSAGVLAAPGSYSVSFGRRIDGTLEDLGQSHSFDVISIREPVIEGMDQDERVASLRGLDETIRAVSGSIAAIDELLVATDAIKEWLMNSTAEHALYDRTQTIEKTAKALRDRLAGNPTREIFNDYGLSSIEYRLFVALFSPTENAFGLTATQRMSLEIAETQFAEVSAELKQLIDQDYEALKQDLDAAGVPWTPGRGVPIAD